MTENNTNNKHHYDVFISHRSENKPWVITLAENLKKCGFSLFLDIWDLVPGHPLNPQLHNAISCSEHFILVATPESLESSWVQDEVDLAMGLRRAQQRDFCLLPITFGPIPQFPFLSNQLCVDFSDPNEDGYRLALHRVVAGLKNQPPGSAIDLPDDIVVPNLPIPLLEDMQTRPLVKGEAAFLGEVFATLHRNQPIMLLSQADRDKTVMHAALLEEARNRFGIDNTLHLVPPGHQKVNESDYFNYLGRQCQAAGPIDSPISFDFLLDDRLMQGKPLFLLITRLEDGNPACRVTLANILRNHNDRYPGLINLVLCGSEQLMGLRFAAGNLSPLNTAETLFWPEPGSDDLMAWQQDRYPGPQLDRDEARKLLSLTGSHPLLLRHCLRWRQTHNTPTEEEFCQSILDNVSLQARFIRHRELDNGERLMRLLNKERLGPYLHWPEDLLLRSLFWDNLLANHEGQLAWRCPLIREIGRKALL